MKKFNLVLQDSYSIANNVHHFCFNVASEESEAFTFKAGQFISLHLERDDKVHRRNYSIANSPAGNAQVDIAISFIPGGLASTALQGLKKGEALPASGPYGQFVLKDDPIERLLLIGTGTGITPYRSMLPSLSQQLEDNPALEVIVLQGVRNREAVLYEQDFLNFAEEHPRFKFVACYSRGLPELPASHEYHGYVQQYLENLTISPEKDLAYLCGNPKMVDEVFERLQTAGLDRKNIRREKYLSSK